MSFAQSTVSNCVTDVTAALVGIAADFIYLPTQEEANEVSYIYICTYICIFRKGVVFLYICFDDFYSYFVIVVVTIE